MHTCTCMDRKVSCHIVRHGASCDRIWFWKCLGAAHSRTKFLDQKSTKTASKSLPEVLLDEFGGHFGPKSQEDLPKSNVLAPF